MAFPSNPNNGDLYNGYRYNSTTGAWEVAAVLPGTSITVDDIAVNGGDITTDEATLNIGSSSTALNIGTAISTNIAGIADGAEQIKLSIVSRGYTSVAVTSNGNVYAAGGASNPLYMQIGGTGDFESLNQTLRQWYGLTVDSDNNVYACVYGGDIYIQSGGTGNFTALGQTSRSWFRMATAPNGDIYAIVYGGDIYKRAGGVGNFIALNQTTRNWTGITAASNGDIYACVYNGDIYKQTGGTGDFVGISETSRSWRGITIAASNDIFAVVYSGDVYKQTGGTGSFKPLGYPPSAWESAYYSPVTGIVYGTLAANTPLGVYQIYKYATTAGNTIVNGDLVITGGTVGADIKSTATLATLYDSTVTNIRIGSDPSTASKTITIGSTNNTDSIYLPSTLASSSSTTGALRVAGGVGIVGRLYGGSYANFANTITATVNGSVGVSVSQTSNSSSSGSGNICYDAYTVSNLSSAATPYDDRCIGVRNYFSIGSRAAQRGFIGVLTDGQIGGTLVKANYIEGFRSVAPSISTSQALPVIDLIGFRVYKDSKDLLYQITNRYGILVDEISGGLSKNYAIYTSGATPSYLGGDVTIGKSLTINGSVVSETNAVTALNQTSRNWYHMTATSTGNVYAVVYGGDIYMQTGGTGDFVALNQTVRNWWGIAAAPNGNVYASTYGGDIYMQTGGTGDFVALNQTSRNWTGLTVTSTGNVYACVDGGSIYMQTEGTGNFISLSQTSRPWYGIAAASNGDVYAVAFQDNIYKQTGGTGTFVSLGQYQYRYYAIAIAPNNDIFVGVSLNTTLKMKPNGHLEPVSTYNYTNAYNYGLAITPNGKVYNSKYGGDIYTIYQYTTVTGETNINTNINLAANTKLDWNSSNVTLTHSAGTLTTAGADLTIKATSTETRSLKIGDGRADDGSTVLDLIGDATYTDYGLRIIRNSGVNGVTDILHRGTGNLNINADEAAAISLSTDSTERLNISSVGLVDVKNELTYNRSTPGTGTAPATTGASTVDFSTGDVFNIVITGNITFTFSNPRDKMQAVIRFQHDASTRTVDFPSAFWVGYTGAQDNGPGGAAYSLSSGNTKYTHFYITYDGANYFISDVPYWAS